MVAADVARYLRNALSAPRVTRTRQSPTVTIDEMETIVMATATMETITVVATRLPMETITLSRRGCRPLRPSRSRRSARARGCELRTMSGGDEEGVEGWSGTVNQSNTSQPSDFYRGFVEGTMDRDLNDSQPIYRQLRDRVVAMILDGVLNEGDPLPSVRNVAAEYRVNPLTVLKGYQQLVDEQLVEKKRGRGMFINSGARDLLLQGERQKFLADEWPKIHATIQRLGLEPAALLQRRRPASRRSADHVCTATSAWPRCIEARGLRKAFGKNVALDNLDLRVAEGRIVGLIGPNGAGKTTALKAILGLTPYEGELRVLGRNPYLERNEVMQDVCFIADVAVLPPWLKVSQALDFVGGVHPRFDRAKAEAFLAKTDDSARQPRAQAFEGHDHAAASRAGHGHRRAAARAR